MKANGRYQFPEGLRAAYERLLFPMAVYQFVGGKVVTLLVSDGMCEFMNVSRDELVNHYNENMFESVHPDDRGMLARLGARFAEKEGPYDVVYRDRAKGATEYRYVHTIGKYHSMDDGSRVAFLNYRDITESMPALVKTVEEASSPQARFLDENGTAMIIVSVEGRRVLYSNIAARRMLPPQTIYDSYLTFQDYFYRDIPDAMPGLFDSVDAGLRRIVEPRTGRTLEVDVTESQWGGDRAYVLRLFEVGSDAEGAHESAADELHRRRVAFNDAMYVGKGTDLAYWQQDYQGIRVWDLTANRMVSSSGNDYLRDAYGEGMTYDEYLAHIAGGDRKGGAELLRSHSREALMLSFENGLQPPEVLVELGSEEGPAFIRARFIMRRSPDGGDVFLRVSEENVTDHELDERLIEATVSREFDFIAYVDVAGDICHVVFGHSDEDKGRSVSVRLDEYCPTLSELVGRHFATVEGLSRFLRESCCNADEPSESIELADGSIKNVRVSMLDPAREVYCIRRTDVTELIGESRRREHELTKAKLEADRANEAKSTFLSSMSHDLRTPLNGVLGFTALALREPDVEKKQEYLEKIDSSGRLLLDLVNDTLELSRIESGKVLVQEEAVMPRDLIPAVVTALRPTAELKGVRLLERYDVDETAPVWCDKLKVQKIALNLISNAIKYTPEGGTVSVSVVPAADADEGCARSLIVEDDGIGMSAEFMKRMFEPFSQEKRSEAQKTPGTGLGLSIVRRYVDLMGGTIDVRSVVHEGTRWAVTLPISEVPEEAVRKERTAEAGQLLSGMRVLLCEDNFMNTEIATMLLKERGIQVEATDNGRRGLERFSASEPGYYDAILMDMQMPVMGGLEATRRIRALERPDAKTVHIIAMTADAFGETMLDARNAGMDGYLTKPIDPAKLFEALSRKEGCRSI